MTGYLSDTIDECLKILDENVDFLARLEMDLEDNKEDSLETDMQLYQLIDMAEDVHDSSKLKQAEINLIKRQEEPL